MIYTPLDIPLVKPERISDMAARALYAGIMNDRHQRNASFLEFVRAAGFAADRSDEGVQAVNDFFLTSIESVDGVPTPLWLSITWDFALLVGEIAIERYPNLRWKLDSAPRSISYNLPVIVGFTKAQSPRFAVPIFYAAERYALSCAGFRPAPFTLNGKVLESTMNAPAPDWAMKVLEKIASSA